jgi:2-haloacid dehalogenase
MTAIRHYVFDIGGVLLHFDPEIPYRKIIPDVEERRWFLENVCSHDWNLAQDRGRPWSEGEAQLIALYPEHEANIRAYRQNWRQMVPHALLQSVAIMEAMIARGHDVTLLTNFAADTFEEAVTIFPFLQRARGATVSGRIGIIKPEVGIYRHHERTFGTTPAATLFVDDNARNVEAAQALGWNAIAFTNAEALEADLKRFGADL